MTEKAIYLVYCSALAQLLIEAIDKAGDNNLFRYDLKQVANRFRNLLMEKISKLYSNNTDNAISEEAELQFYDFTNLLELQLSLIMQMNSNEREELIALLSKVQQRLKAGL